MRQHCGRWHPRWWNPRCPPAQPPGGHPGIPALLCGARGGGRRTARRGSVRSRSGGPASRGRPCIPGVPAAGQDVLGRAGDLFAFHEQGQRLVAGIQRPRDHLGLSAIKRPFRLQSIAQLGLGQAGVDVQLWRGKSVISMMLGMEKAPLCFSYFSTRCAAMQKRAAARSGNRPLVFCLPGITPSAGP